MTVTVTARVSPRDHISPRAARLRLRSRFHWCCSRVAFVQQLSQLLLDDDSLEAELAHVAREVLIQIIEDLAHEYVRCGTAALKIK